MKIKFLVDFRGVETQERLYLKGAEVEFEDALAARLVKEGRAVFCEPAKVEEPARVERKKRHGND